MQIGGKESGEGVGREAVEGRSFQAAKKIAAQTLTAEILEVGCLWLLHVSSLQRIWLV